MYMQLIKQDVLGCIFSCSVRQPIYKQVFI